MKKMIFAAVAALGLSGCVYDGYSTGLSVGYGRGYGYNYPYYGHGYSPCISYDRYGRQYYSCGFGGYSGSRYSYSPRSVIYYYPGYIYRNGYYYDRYNRRYDSNWLYRRYHRHHRRN